MRRKPRLVIDTNVVVSALLWGGKPLELLALAEQGEARLYASPPLLAELKKTIGKPKLARVLAASGRSAEEHVADYRRLVTLMRRALPAGAWSRDPDDDRVVACALAAGADFLVTGDDDLLTLGTIEGVRIVTPAALFDILA
jgi:putative PIN family toxin of toxin-antitoxin system